MIDLSKIEKLSDKDDFYMIEKGEHPVFGRSNDRRLLIGVSGVILSSYHASYHNALVVRESGDILFDLSDPCIDDLDLYFEELNRVIEYKKIVDSMVEESNNG